MSAPIRAAGGPSSAQNHSEFGTLWIQGQNGVPQMVRVLHATPTKLVSNNSSDSSSAPVSSAGAVVSGNGTSNGNVSILRAVVKPATSLVASTNRSAALTASSSSTVPQVIRRSVLPNSPAPRRVMVSTSGRRPLTPKRRVLPSSSVQVGGVTVVTPAVASTSAVRSTFSNVNQHQYHQKQKQQPQQVLVRTKSPSIDRSPVTASSRTSGAVVSPVVVHGGARKRQTYDDVWSDIKRRRVEKSNKGLRHFSMKVCEKVRAKGKTTYNEVADELVAEYSDPRSCEPSLDQPYDQKNIRRRVYDALNVLMALHIISKEKKEIRWLGLPSNALQDCKKLEREKAERTRRINVKTQQLKDLLLQQIAFKRLVERNREAERVHGPPLPSSTIQLPFIVVNTDKKTVIDCSISNDKMEYLFNFDDTFEIHDDIEVLKRMGMALGLERGNCSQRDIQLGRSLVAPALASYIDQLGREGAASDSTVVADLDDASRDPDGDDRSSCVTPNIDVDSDVGDDLDYEYDEVE